MRFLRANLTLKYILFLLVTISPAFVLIFALNSLGKSEKLIFFSVSVVFLIIIVFGFIFLVSRPLKRVAPQAKALLTGKKYKRLKPLSPDEIGVVTHFFNEVTRNLEKISSDLVEQRRLFSEVDVARSIQQDVLPKSTQDIEGLEIMAKTKAAAEMGGDSFDFIQRDQNTLVYIGDVTGHGIPAGLVMMMVNTLIHAYAANDKMPAEILTMVNDVLCDRISSQRFMTLVMLRWDALRRKMYYTGAGHEHILIYRAKTQQVETIKSGGIALRMTPNIGAIIEEKELDIDPDDVVLLYTDGITEARNQKGEMFGLERLKVTLQENAYKKSLESIFDKISDEFSDFVGSDYVQEDDITMIVMRELGEDEKQQKKAVKLVLNSGNRDSLMNGSRRWTW